jgi:hypothetical protein
MGALLLFHLHAGVRVAVRACTLMLGAIVAWITLYASDPAAIVIGFSQAAFSRQPLIEDVVPLVGLALLLPAWAAARLSSGLNGWLRHLPFTSTDNRRGLALALVTVQLPLLLILIVLGFAARGQEIPTSVPAARWALVLTAGAIASLPVRHRYTVVPMALTALAMALVGPGAYMAVSAMLLIGSDAVAGPIRTMPRRSPRAAGSLLQLRIAWRAVGARMLRAYGAGLLALGAGWLFIVNNDLAGPRVEIVARFAGSVASILCMSSLAKTLALRRQMWPLARSFPWSATRRVAEDGLFLAAHALPLVLLVGVASGKAALQVLALVPCLALLAAGRMRRIPERRSHAVLFVGEGLLAASILTLLPWTAFAWLVGAVPALRFSAECERRLKVTRWSDWNHDDAGDPTVRSER